MPDDNPAKPATLGNFEWVVFPQEVATELKPLKLAKMMAIKEGDIKPGAHRDDAQETYTRENVISGAGGMRASAILGQSWLSIDHITELPMPEQYTKDYGDGIGDPYPVGFMVDAQAVEIDGKMHLEALAIILNETVWRLLAEKKFVGVSVEDAVREMTCACKGENESCSCQTAGSTFLSNTLVLKEVPATNGTWVTQVTDAEKETMLSVVAGDADNNWQRQPAAAPETIVNTIRKNLTRVQTNALDDYMTEGKWNKGQESVSSYLVSEKNMDEPTAVAMSEYLFQNPDALSQYQLAEMSTEDLSAWWNTFAMQLELTRMRRKIASLEWLEHNNKPLQKLKKINAVPLKPEEVNYGTRAEASLQCNSCRWFSSWWDTGDCQLLCTEVRPLMGCDRHELPVGPGSATTANPETAPGGQDADPPAEMKKNEEDDPDKKENMDEETAPDENGECPEGYVLSEDGTKCVMAEKDTDDDDAEMKEDDAGGDGGGAGTTPPVQQKPVPVWTKTSTKKFTRKALVENHGSTKRKEAGNKLNKKIEDLKNRMKSLKKELAYLPMHSKQGGEKMAEYRRLETELKLQFATKKK